MRYKTYDHDNFLPFYFTNKLIALTFYCGFTFVVKLYYKIFKNIQF